MHLLSVLALLTGIWGGMSLSQDRRVVQYVTAALQCGHAMEAVGWLFVALIQLTRPDLLNLGNTAWVLVPVIALLICSRLTVTCPA